MTLPIKKGDRITCLIHDLGSSGEGVGDYQGVKIFVEGALPEEKIFAKVTEVKKTYAKAKLIRIETSSPKRANPPCPFYEECGGCQIQHLTEDFQREMKRKRVEQALKRIGKIEGCHVLPCVPSERNFGYRNKIQFPFSLDKKLGLYKKSSHEIVPIDYCLLHLPLGEQVFKWLKPPIEESSIQPYDEITRRGEFRHLLIRSTAHTNEALVGFVTTRQPTQVFMDLARQLRNEFPFIKGVLHLQNNEETNRVLSHRSTLLTGKNEIHEKVGDFLFSFSLESFFQVNPLQAARLYQRALDIADISSEDRVLDAFCGVGTLAAFFAQRAKMVYGVECVPGAIENAKKNALLNKIDNSEFICGDIDQLIGNYTGMDWVILNPPRKGCSERTLEEVARSSPKGIVYVSCDPATLARDLNLLTQKEYRICHVEPFDMFPQTMHVETLVILKHLRHFPL